MQKDSNELNAASMGIAASCSSGALWGSEMQQDFALVKSQDLGVYESPYELFVSSQRDDCIRWCSRNETGDECTC